MINLKQIKHRLIHFFRIPRKEPCLSEPYANIEKHYTEGINVPFKITDIREKGFLVKVSGVFGHISFNHMPWKYHDTLSWKAIFPYLKGKVLFGKIHQLDKGTHTIIIDGNTPQFKKPQLIEGNKYKGIIVNKTNYGVFVDIGYGFRWKSGSLMGLLHRLDFESNESFKKSNIGETIEMFFWGYKDQDKLIFGEKEGSKVWYTGEIENLIGVTLPVNVIKTNKRKPAYQAVNKYAASLQLNNIIYPKNLSLVKKAAAKLKDGEIIHCKVMQINKQNRTLFMKWESLTEINYIIESGKNQIKKVKVKDNHKKTKTKTNSGDSDGTESIIVPRNTKTKKNLPKQILKKINPKINGEAAQKPITIGKKVKVQIIKRRSYTEKGDYTKYIVENKYLGKLEIANKNYSVNEKEQQILEKNLRDGDTSYCEVLKIESNQVTVKWFVSDYELIAVSQN